MYIMFWTNPLSFNVSVVEATLLHAVTLILIAYSLILTKGIIISSIHEYNLLSVPPTGHEYCCGLTLFCFVFVAMGIDCTR